MPETGVKMAGSMNVITDKYKALQKFQDTIEERVILTCKAYEPEIIDMNTAKLESGETSTGNPVTPGYRPLTISIKRQKGQPTDRVTLKDTGDFHRSFQVRFQGKYLAIYATDEKAEKLERKYSKDIYGLSNEDQDELAQMILPGMRKNLINAI